MSKAKTKPKATKTKARNAEEPVQTATSEPMPTVAVPGVWTPWAAILCLPCHGPKIERGFGQPPKTIDEWDTREIKREPMSGEGIALCDECRIPVCVRSDVAAMQAVGYALSELAELAPFGWRLDQTGGMSAALTIHRDPHGDEIVVFDSEGGGMNCLSAATLDVTKPEDERLEDILETSDEVPYSEPERMARWILDKLGIEPEVKP